MAQDDWQERFTRFIAGEVRRHRQAQKMSAQQLADRCEELGLEMPRSVIANLENGRRESVSVAELLILATALDVAPVLLTAPLGYEPKTEILPGRFLRTWDAVLWQSGETRLPSDPSVEETDWLDVTDDQAVVPLFHEHDELMHDLATIGPSEAIINARGKIVKTNADLRARTEASLRQLRARMRQLGLSPPQLPADLAYIDHGRRGRRGSR